MKPIRHRHLIAAVAFVACAVAVPATAQSDPAAEYATARADLLGKQHRSRLTVAITTKVGGTTGRQDIAVSEVATGPTTFSAGGLKPANLLDRAVRVVGIGTRYTAVERDGTAYVGTPKARLQTLLSPQSVLRLPEATMLGNHEQVPPNIAGTRRYVVNLNADAARVALNALLADDAASRLGGASQIRTATLQYSVDQTSGAIVRTGVVLVALVPKKSLALVPDLWLTGDATGLTYTVRATYVPAPGGAPVTITAPPKTINLDAIAYDTEARSLLRKGATALENYYLLNKTFGTATPAKLRLRAPQIEFTVGGNGLALKRRIGLTDVNGGHGYQLRTTSRTGRVYTYRRDAIGQVERTCRTRAGKSCGTW